MNLDKGIIRIWLIIIPIVWIVSFIYYFNSIQLPFYSCETPDSKKKMCKYSNGPKDIYLDPFHEDSCIKESWVLCSTIDLKSNIKSYKTHKFNSENLCIDFFKDANIEVIEYPKTEYSNCLDIKKTKQKKFFSNLFFIIIFPFTFYPIYLLSKRLYKWVKEGFNK